MELSISLRFLILLTYTWILYSPRTWVTSSTPGLSAMEEQFYLLWPAVQGFLELVQWTVISNSCFYFSTFQFRLISIRVLGASVRSCSSRSLPVYQATFTPIASGVALAYLLHNEKSFRVLYWIIRKALVVYFPTAGSVYNAVGI